MAVPDPDAPRKCIFTPLGNSMVMAPSLQPSPEAPLEEAENPERKLTGANSAEEVVGIEERVRPYLDFQ